MNPVTNSGSSARPPTPWPGSQYQTRHRWQLDGVRTLPEAGAALRAIALELVAAYEAGWELVEPMRGGHLLAARQSRRQRGQLSATQPPAAAAPAISWRLRVVDEPPLPGDTVLDLDAAAARRTPVVAWDGSALTAVGGQHTGPEVLARTVEQLTPADVRHGRWGVAPARVGPSLDLVADGSAIRVHALVDGALVRTAEALPFQHGADHAGTLLSAAAAYERVARAADAMTAAGGRLVTVDDGLLHIAYGAA